MTTFLYPAVKHIALRIRAKADRYISAEDTLPELPAAVPAEADHSRAELAEVLTKLPQGQREVLLLRFVDDMTLEQISQALDISISTVKSRLYRALDKLRQDKRIKDYFLED